MSCLGRGSVPNCESFSKMGSPSYYRGGVILARNGSTVMPDPVLWQGTPAKVAVVAVPNSNAAVLSLQRTDSDTAGRGYRLATAALR